MGIWQLFPHPRSKNTSNLHVLPTDTIMGAWKWSQASGTISNVKKKNVTGAYPFSKWFNVPLAFHPIGLGVEGISPLETKWEAYGKPLPKELCSGRSHFNEAAGQAFSFHHGRHRCQSMAFHQAAGDSRWRRAFPRWDNDPKPVVSASSHGTTTGIHHKTDQETENWKRRLGVLQRNTADKHSLWVFFFSILFSSSQNNSFKFKCPMEKYFSSLC